jgi:FkbM family methyltransferase
LEVKANPDLKRNGNVKTFKKLLQAKLSSFHLHQRLRASYVYDLYWSIADKRLIEARSREVDFYRNLLNGFRKGDLIFDAGANQGAKTDVFLRLGARVVAIEPDEYNRDVLREKFLKCRLSPKPVIIVDQALSDQIGVNTMWIDEPGSAKNTLSQKWVEALRCDEGRFGHTLDFAQKKQIQTTTLEELINAFGVPFFVKIDVEGFEPNVLRGLRRPVPYLSFEVNLPEFKPEGLQCVQLLGRLDAGGTFNYTADCQHGLVLERWLALPEFLRALEECPEKSIEIFWKTQPSIGR